MITNVTKEGVRAVNDISKFIENTFNNFDFDSRLEYVETVTYLESCLKHVINDLKEYPPLDI